MAAQPVPRPELSLEEAAAVIYAAQERMKELGAQRKEIDAAMHDVYLEIEDAAYGLRGYLSQERVASARIGEYEVEAKYDRKNLRVAEIAVAWTGEKRIVPSQPTTRIVVRKAKP